jgi:hypothetical protein
MIKGYNLNKDGCAGEDQQQISLPTYRQSVGRSERGEGR